MNRLEVKKTLKLYIDGQFPRTESGRYYSLENVQGENLANICQASRKDFRNAVVAARKAQPSWEGKSAYNRGQIIYRLAEMLESRSTAFVEELRKQGAKKSKAESEVRDSIDRLVYYAGWADKFRQVFSTVNPVSSSHFNFSMPEPTGVVGIIAPEHSSLLGLISSVIPVIVSGNTCVVLASNSLPLCAISLAEAINSSDVPAGVVNILTGDRKELLPFFSSHMDVNAVVYYGDDKKDLNMVQELGAQNMKRVKIREEEDLFKSGAQGPYHILDTLEIKTTWHPVGI
jgi:acyl-CoA reductase-like NAD-dependent aldehyde dehydrogenase